jgi:predicted ABC-type transport system involved in lysophospholipase L1 biosynthesis ATPase subunit
METVIRSRPVPLVQLTSVCRTFAAPSGNDLRVIQDVSLEVGAGESLALLGPSGSGKSTLLHLIGGLDRPTGGEVRIRGRNLAELDEAALSELRAREVGFVFQHHYLLPQCTVFENAMVPTLALSATAGGGREKKQDRAKRLLERVGLEARLNHLPGELSGGERQRVAVVRALVNKPGLLLADEPTGALDQESAAALADLLCELNREENVTLILATHSLELAARMARRFRIRQGKLTLAAE